MMNGDTPRASYEAYHAWFADQNAKHLDTLKKAADRRFRRTGITFNVYGEKDADERLIPFEIVPRIISAAEWRGLLEGIEQRVKAINAFLHDIYHKQEIIKAGIVPEHLISENEAFLPHMVGFTPPGRVYTHIVGVDLVRTGADEFLVLEDNARTPSGVSYMLENREAMLQVFPELFANIKVRSVSDYPERLSQSLARCAPAACKDKPVIAVLTPGAFNSAYFEHAFLADQMGAELVEGHDIRIEKGRVCMRTTQGFKPVDILYRRVDDEYLDPLNFNPESLLGIPGLMDVYRAGGITIANAPGAGIADDKAIYSYMPDIVRFYTGQKAKLKNVETYRCSEPEILQYVLDNLKDLVVKEVHGSGGYGMLVGPKSTKAEIKRFHAKLKADPDNYIAQPTLALSTAPIFHKGDLSPRHVDLRPYVLVGPDKIVTAPGGLTRVALKQGSLVVNSSQGGGTKDTWVLEE